MFKKTVITGSLLLAAAFGMSRALADDRHDDDRRPDRVFVARAASGGQLEVRVARYVEKNADRDAVKDFARHMVDDHTKANDELNALADHEGIDVPKDLNDQDHDTLERLKKLKGHELDRAYISQMVQDHQQDIAAFQDEARDGRDDRLRDFAQREIPILQHHLDMAEEIDHKM